MVKQARQSDAPSTDPIPAEDDGSDTLFNSDSRLVFDVSIDLRRLAIACTGAVLVAVGYIFFEIACE